MKNVVTSFLFLWCWTVHAQPRRTVVDAGTGKPVPYATVKILHTGFGQIASPNGEFIMRISVNDTVLITSVGYQNAVLPGNIIGNTVALTPRPAILEMVTIKQRKVAGRFMRGNGVDYINEKIECNYKKDGDNDCLPWGPGASAEFAEAIDLPDSLKTYHLGKVWLPLKTIACWQPVFFNIYDADTAGLPGNLIYQQYISEEPAAYKKGKLTMIDLSQDNIYFDKTKRFFIGISWDENYQDKVCTTTIMLLKAAKGVSYSRHLKSQQYNWFVFMQGKYNSVFAVEIEELKE